MAFLKKARAAVVHANWGPSNWQQFMNLHRQEMVSGFSRTASSDNLVTRASEILQDDFNADKYLLTHATIVASVDVSSFPGIKVGNVQENGRMINRKWADYRISPESDPFINNNCFIPGTLITMADGTLKPIEEIREGDEVISHLGRTRRVRAVMKRPVNEEIIEIHPRSTTERLYATGEHPFFVFRENQCVNCGKATSHNSNYNARCVTHLIGKFYCSRDCWYAKKIRKDELLPQKTGEFVEAQHLTDRDFVSVPVLEETKSVDLTLGQARLIGLFLAEGYYEYQSRNDNERVGAVWAFHAKEKELISTVSSLMMSEFGVECVVREHSKDNGVHVTTRTNRDAAAFFSHWVRGSDSRTKTLHPDLLRAPKNLQLEVLRGWFEGDGCLQDTLTEDTPGDVRLTGTTSSRSLANQIQVILRRLGVSSRLTRSETEGRSRVLVDGKVKIIPDSTKPSNVCWSVAVGASSLEELVQTTYYEDAFFEAMDRRPKSIQSAPHLRFLNGYEIQIIQSIRSVAYEGLVYNFDVEEDHSYIANGFAVHNCDAWSRGTLLKSYQTFIGGHNFLEHVQIEEQSKGRIIDAVARDIGPSVYVDILIATNRKHAQLVQDIEQGRMSTLSMGCSVTETQCTKCGHVAADETQMCEHIKYSKGNYEFGPDGQRYRIAELCGHESLDPTGGVHFIEASWVAVPAFQGAVMRNILKPEAISISTKEQVRNVLASPPPSWVADPQGQAKAARLAFDFGEDDAEGGEDKKEEASDPMEELESEIEQQVLDNVKKRIKDRLKKEVQEKAVSDGELATSTGNSIVHQGSLSKRATEYRASIGALVKVARSDIELLDNLARLNQSLGIRVSRDMYLASLRVGSTANYDTSGAYLAACSKVLGRKPTSGEAKTLVRLGQILSLRK